MDTPISRRRALALGGSIAGGIVAASSPLLGGTPRGVAGKSGRDARNGGGGSFSQVTIKQLEAILQTNGTQQNGVLSFELERKDLTGYTLGGNSLSSPVPFSPSWENNGMYFFQKLGGRDEEEGRSNSDSGAAILNGDFGGLLPQEIDPFIDQLLSHGLVFQALHQHFYDIHPNQLYFIHFRGIGDPLQLARAAIAAVKVTGAPLPQFQSSMPTTPLPADQLAHILGGDAHIGSDGVVTVDVPRMDRIILDDVRISPFLNVATTIAFEPLDSSGSKAAVAPDFGLTSSEIQGVIEVMRQQGWVIGCLYNQETDEFPQLYFSHQVKVGDPISLAHEIRRGLDRMNVARA
ncbi:MAG: hypothetical protein JWO59_3335 [Chloroflexi bacterium]|nr:hypothetical protein [Chloroflexota bacterium]